MVDRLRASRTKVLFHWRESGGCASSLKIEDDPASPALIVTERGAGYQLARGVETHILSFF
jgi:hypothetical protein